MREDLSEKRVHVLGVPVDCVDMDQALAATQAMLGAPGPHRIVAVNPEKVVKAQEDNFLRTFLVESDLLIPDGIGVVLAAKLLGLGSMSRVAGADLMPRICELAAHGGHGVFLFGATEDANAEACRILQMRYPGLRIVGRQNGYVEPSGMADVVEKIRTSGADILFVALGSPRQEHWMNTHLPDTGIRVCQGVGGTFDVLAGKVRRAPSIFRRLHLEWLYRLLSQPSRILRQTALPRFAWQVIKERMVG